MCKNPVTYIVLTGPSEKQITLRCGSTDPHGNPAICDHCLHLRRHKAAPPERIVSVENLVGRATPPML